MSAPIARGPDLAALAAVLERAGCVAAAEEAAELVAAARGDDAALGALVARRCAGEPLAWLTGSVRFCGRRIAVDPGVYVPRWQSEPLAREALARLPDDGVAVDLCTGSGAIAVVLARGRPRARVVATERDPRAVACARRNGVAVFEGDLAAPLPAGLAGSVDVVTAVVPYVPTEELAHLPRDVLAHEPRAALDGGPHGTVLLVAVVAEAAALVRPGGSLLVELGGEQADRLAPVLAARGFGDVALLADDDGDLRGLAARRQRPAT